MVPRERWLRASLGGVLFVYMVWFRVHGLSERFGMYEDQIHDWQIALRPFADLPSVGVPTSVGGFTLGPIYYWLLWLIARIVRPFTGPLPHGGGYALATLQSAVDVALWYALTRRTRSPMLALAVVVLAVTSSMDAAFSSAVWGPPVAVLFAKCALALALLGDGRAIGWTIAVVAASWCAVQTHMSGVFVAAALIGRSLVEPLLRRGYRTTLIRFSAALAVILVMQIPWALNRSEQSGSPFPSALTSSVATVAGAPAEHLHPIASGSALLHALDRILFNDRLPISVLLIALVGGALVLVTRVRTAALSWCGVAPLVAALVGFSIWQGAAIQMYWYLVLVPSASICLLAWLMALPTQVTRALTVVALVGLAVSQPSRAQSAWNLHRMPYGALLEGSRSLVRSDQAVSNIRLLVPLPAATDTMYLFSLLGGRMESEAPEALISPSGEVRLVPR